MVCRVFATMLSKISRLAPSSIELALMLEGGLVASTPGRRNTSSDSSSCSGSSCELGSDTGGGFSAASFESNSMRNSTRPGICRASPAVLLAFTAVLMAPSYSFPNTTSENKFNSLLSSTSRPARHDLSVDSSASNQALNESATVPTVLVHQVAEFGNVVVSLTKWQLSVGA